MTTASSLLGATAVKFMPGGGAAGVGDEVGVAAGCSPLAQAASADPAPTASTATPPARSIDRRESALTMSPKYSLSVGLGAGLEQASPHLYRQVTCWRDDRPPWATSRFNGMRATSWNLRLFGNQLGSNW